MLAFVWARGDELAPAGHERCAAFFANLTLAAAGGGDGGGVGSGGVGQGVGQQRPLSAGAIIRAVSSHTHSRLASPR